MEDQQPPLCQASRQKEVESSVQARPNHQLESDLFRMSSPGTQLQVMPRMDAGY